MKFYLSDHQGKGRRFAEALMRFGWEQAESPAESGLDLALYDHDVGAGGMGFRNGLDWLYWRGVPVMMYPHAARPMLQWDGMYPVWEHTRVCLTIAEGHREVMRRFGYPLPVEPVGWSYCEQRQFEAIKKGEGERIRVLFGPIHPNRNGWLHPMDMDKNRQVYQVLLATPGIELTVRHIHRLDLNGLWTMNGVKYVQGKPDGSTREIDEADVVIGHQTFAWLAAARGKPVVMFGDDLIPHSGNRPENMRFAKSWEKYRDYLRYPANVEDVILGEIPSKVDFYGGSGMKLSRIAEVNQRHGRRHIAPKPPPAVDEAVRAGERLTSFLRWVMEEDVGAEWRERFIGKPFDDGYFVGVVERYLEEGVMERC